MIETGASLVGGLIALLVGGEMLVRGAVRLAEKAGVTPLIVGLVIVGFGTSTPELMTSVEHVFIGGREVPLTSRQTELRDRYRRLDENAREYGRGTP